LECNGGGVFRNDVGVHRETLWVEKDPMLGVGVYIGRFGLGLAKTETRTI
jgi:hypothetical protein